MASSFALHSSRLVPRELISLSGHFPVCIRRQQRLFFMIFTNTDNWGMEDAVIGAAFVECRGFCENGDGMLKA